jgi:hypothetical protein
VTQAEYIAKLNRQIEQLRTNAPLAIAAQHVHAMRVERIFDTPGVGGSYNRTKPIWVKNTELRRKNKGKSGKAQKTSYFSSYYALKQDQGFDPNVVNLRLTNDLQSDFANSAKSNGVGRPQSGKVIKVSNALYVEAIRRPKNIKKLKANLKRYGNFLAFTPAERAKFHEINRIEFIKLLQG